MMKIKRTYYNLSVILFFILLVLSINKLSAQGFKVKDNLTFKSFQESDKKKHLYAGVLISSVSNVLITNFARRKDWANP